MSNTKQQTPLIFPTYLIPTFSFPLSLPFRKRHSSTASASSHLSESFEVASSTPTIESSDVRISAELPLSPHENRSLSPPLSPLSPSFTNTTFPDLHRLEPQAQLQAPHAPLLRCKNCTTHLATTTQIISKGFTGRHGRAYLIAPPSSPPLPAALPFPPRRKIQRNLVNIRVGKCVRRELVTGQHTVADIECAICGAVVGWKYVDAREAQQRYKVGRFILEGGKVVGGRGWEWGGEDSGIDVDDSKLKSTFESGNRDGGEERDDNTRDGMGNDFNNNHNPNSKTTIKDKSSWPSSIERERRYGSGFKKAPSFEPGRELLELEIEMGRKKPDNGRSTASKRTNGQGNNKDNAHGEEEEDVILFDSEDEDECDDLFAGVWDPEVVRRRRWRRKNAGEVSLWRRKEAGGGVEGGWEVRATA